MNERIKLSMAKGRHHMDTPGGYMPDMVVGISGIKILELLPENGLVFAATEHKVAFFPIDNFFSLWPSEISPPKKAGRPKKETTLEQDEQKAKLLALGRKK